jgi:hypothetical protein
MSYNTRALGVPVTMAEPMAQPVAGDTFNVTTRAVHLFWGIAAVRSPSLQHTIAGQLGTGAAVRNLSIRARKRWQDVLVTVLTLGVISTTAVTFEGVVTRP